MAGRMEIHIQLKFLMTKTKSRFSVRKWKSLLK